MASEEPSDSNTFVTDLINQMLSKIPIQTHKNFKIYDNEIDNLLQINQII